MAGEAAMLGSVVRAVRQEGIGEALRWWRSQFAAVFPEAWRRTFSIPTWVSLRREAEGWVISVPGPTGSRYGETVPDPAGPALLKAALDRAVAAFPSARGNVWLDLREEELMVLQTELPMGAEEDIASALSLDLDRLTPLPSDRAFFGFHVLGRDWGSKSLRVEIFVAAHDAVIPRLAELRALGVRVLGVGLAGGGSDSARINLLPTANRDAPVTPLVTVAYRLMWALTLALLAALVVIPIAQKHQRAAELLPRLQGAKQEAAVSDRVARDIERLVAEHNYVVARKHAQPSLTLLLEELSRELPDNTWVQQLEVRLVGKTREVQITGETAASSALISNLERSGTLSNATYKSPLTKGSGPNSERFVIAAEFKARTPPESAAEAAPAAGAQQLDNPPTAALAAGAAPVGTTPGPR